MSAPWLLRGYGLLASAMLAPVDQAQLALRVRHLTETRTEALDTGAAEIRRIERDLHDGAQARLVAMGMTLDAAGQIIDTDPALRGQRVPGPGQLLLLDQELLACGFPFLGGDNRRGLHDGSFPGVSRCSFSAASAPSQSRASAARNCCAVRIGADLSR